MTFLYDVSLGWDLGASSSILCELRRRASGETPPCSLLTWGGAVWPGGWRTYVWHRHRGITADESVHCNRRSTSRSSVIRLERTTLLMSYRLCVVTTCGVSLTPPGCRENAWTKWRRINSIQFNSTISEWRMNHCSFTHTTNIVTRQSRLKTVRYSNHKKTWWMIPHLSFFKQTSPACEPTLPSEHLRIHYLHWAPQHTASAREHYWVWVALQWGHSPGRVLQLWTRGLARNSQWWCINQMEVPCRGEGAFICLVLRGYVGFTATDSLLMGCFLFFPFCSRSFSLSPFLSLT